MKKSLLAWIPLALSACDNSDTCIGKPMSKPEAYMEAVIARINGNSPHINETITSTRGDITVVVGRTGSSVTGPAEVVWSCTK